MPNFRVAVHRIPTATALPSDGSPLSRAPSPVQFHMLLHAVARVCKVDGCTVGQAARGHCELVQETPTFRSRELAELVSCPRLGYFIAFFLLLHWYSFSSSGETFCRTWRDLWVTLWTIYNFHGLLFRPFVSQHLDFLQTVRLNSVAWKCDSQWWKTVTKPRRKWLSLQLLETPETVAGVQEDSLFDTS